MLFGERSFPFQNPDPNLPLPLPYYHGGYSDEDDSGFQNWLKNETINMSNIDQPLCRYTKKNCYGKKI